MLTGVPPQGGTLCARFARLLVNRPGVAASLEGCWAARDVLAPRLRPDTKMGALRASGAALRSAESAGAWATAALCAAEKFFCPAGVPGSFPGPLLDRHNSHY